MDSNTVNTEVARNTETHNTYTTETGRDKNIIDAPTIPDLLAGV